MCIGQGEKWRKESKGKRRKTSGWRRASAHGGTHAYAAQDEAVLLHGKSSKIDEVVLNGANQRTKELELCMLDAAVKCFRNT